MPTLPVTLPYAPLPRQWRAAGIPPPALSLSLHVLICCVRSALRGPKPADPDRLHISHLCQRAAAVFGAAAVHQDGTAAAWRLAGGVVGGDGVLSVAAARRLCLCALSDAAAQPHDSGDRASGAAGDRIADAAAVDCERLGRTPDLGLCVLAIGPVRGFDRAAVFRAGGEQSAAAGLVRPHRPPERSRSLFPLCFLRSEER